MGLIFLLFDIVLTLLVPFIAYCSTYNAYFMDLPVSSFVSLPQAQAQMRQYSEYFSYTKIAGYNY